MSETPQTRFARNGDVHIAFQTVGAGPLDILLVDTWFHHVEAVWDFPDLARFLRRLSSFGRLIHFDRRGTGLSDPVPLDRLPSVETQVEDVLAVLDAAEADRPAVVGLTDGGLVATVLAANHPERCRSLVLFPAVGKHHEAGGMPMEVIDQVLEEMTRTRTKGGSGVEILAPSRANDERFSQHLARLQRYSVRPGAIAHFFRQTMLSDVGDLLPAMRVPTLVLNRAEQPALDAQVSAETLYLVRIRP
jgi:pimeloyl-ACP methyl ester carboxylesterase